MRSLRASKLSSFGSCENTLKQHAKGDAHSRVHSRVLSRLRASLTINGELASRLVDENRCPKHSGLVGSVLKTAVIFGPVIGFVSDRLFS